MENLPEEDTATDRTTLVMIENDIGEVKEIVRENFTKVINRGERFDVLETKSEALRDGSHRFATVAKKVRNRMSCKRTMYGLILGLILILLLVLVSVLIARPWQHRV